MSNRYCRERRRRTVCARRKQVQKELALIAKLKLAGYFLIVWDIVRFCREQKILVQGRGSAANSAVCYSLGITAVDPVGMELLFERFLTEERGEWPDIDLDLPSGDQREKAIQYVYQRYGQLGAAMTANVITYRSRSAAREVGKVLGFDQETLDRLIEPRQQRRVARSVRYSGKPFAPSRLRPESFENPEISRAVRTDSGFAATSGPTLGRHGRLPGTARFGCSAGTGLHARSRRRPVGQRRLRGHGDRQSGFARPRDDVGARRVRGTRFPNTMGNRSILRSFLRTILLYTRLCVAPTRSGCFRWKAARRWRLCRAMHPTSSTISSCRWRSFAPVLSSGKMMHPYMRRRQGKEDGSLCPSVAGADSETNARRAFVSGAAVADGDDRREFHRRRGGRFAACDGLQAFGRAHAENRSEAATRNAAERHRQRDAGRNHHADHILRSLWISRIACGKLCFDRLRERLPEVSLPGGIHGRFAQQPADGFLQRCHDREGCPTARTARKTHQCLRSEWLCTIEDGQDKAGKDIPCLRIGFRYVRGLRQASARGTRSRTAEVDLSTESTISYGGFPNCKNRNWSHSAKSGRSILLERESTDARPCGKSSGPLAVSGRCWNPFRNCWKCLLCGR